jgi:hypothetical protein
VVAVIRGREGDEAIGLRADIDALPIPEESGVPYASTNPGVMHACGHDGHTTMLLGAAKYLAASRKFKGTAYLIFQPAEEIGGGSQVVADGLFDRFPMRRIFGMHNMPTMPVGEFRWRNGPIHGRGKLLRDQDHRPGRARRASALRDRSHRGRQRPGQRTADDCFPFGQSVPKHPGGGHRGQLPGGCGRQCNPQRGSA